MGDYCMNLVKPLAKGKDPSRGRARVTLLPEKSEVRRPVLLGERPPATVTAAEARELMGRKRDELSLIRNNPNEYCGQRKIVLGGEISRLEKAPSSPIRNGRLGILRSELELLNTNSTAYLREKEVLIGLFMRQIRSPAKKKPKVVNWFIENIGPQLADFTRPAFWGGVAAIALVLLGLAPASRSGWENPATKAAIERYNEAETRSEAAWYSAYADAEEKAMKGISNTEKISIRKRLGSKGFEQFGTALARLRLTGMSAEEAESTAKEIFKVK